MKQLFCTFILSSLYYSNSIFGQIEAIDIGFDKNEFIYVTGDFDRIIDFGNSNFTNVKGGSDIYVGKYNPAGKCEWGTSIGGLGNENVGGIFVDKSGSFYLVGSLTGECKFGQVKARASATKLYPSCNMFIAKYNMSGDPIWIKTSKNTGMDAAYAISGDDAGNIYVSGVFDNSLIFDGHTVKSNGKTDVFLLKMNSSGSTSWIKAYGGVEDDNCMTVFNDNKHLAIGGSSFIESKCVGNIKDINRDNGSVNWTKNIGTARCEIQKISIDNESNYIITGYTDNLNSAECRDLLVAKLKSTTGDDLWIKKFHGNIPIGNAITCDATGNIYVSGNYIDTLRMDSKYLNGDSFSDFFFAKMNSSGKVISAQTMGNSKVDKAQKLVMLKNKLILFGSFSQGISFGTNKLNGGENSVFLASFDMLKSNFYDPRLLVIESPNADPNVKIIDITGKLLYGKEKNKSFLNDQPLYIEDDNGNIIRRTITDENGDFSFKNIDAGVQMNLVIEKSEKLQNIDEIFLAQQGGVIVDAIKVTKENTFKYKLLPAIITKMEPIEIDDNISLKIKNFKTSTDAELNITQQITYEPNSFKIPAESMVHLNEIATYLRQNQKMRLEIYSYTDAIGDDAANLSLSEKRAEEVKKFLTKKHVVPERIITKGLGETKILNRCENDVNCTEFEHMYNRRTEFKFIRGAGL